MRLFELYKPDDPRKKYKIYVPYKDTFKKIEFGDSSYEDYTTHRDLLRRERYINRHKKRENWDDYTTSGYWSKRVLWGDSTDIDKNLRDAVKYALKIYKTSSKR
jgi:hypothetical protein